VEVGRRRRGRAWRVVRVIEGIEMGGLEEKVVEKRDGFEEERWVKEGSESSFAVTMLDDEGGSYRGGQQG